MKPLTLLLPALLSASTLCGQVQQTNYRLQLPISNPLPRANKLPFGSQVARYQQWFSPLDLKTVLTRPVRLTGMEFRAISAVGPAANITLEIAMTNAAKNGIGGTFATNLGSKSVLVLPKTSVSLAAASAGTWTLAVTFTNQFNWDGQSGILFDVKIYSNSLNKSFDYDFDSTVLSKGRVQRLYNTSSAAATSGTFDDGIGLTTRFVYQIGGSYSYGAGCAGALGLIPEATSNRVPLPGDNGWTQLVAKTSPGKDAFLFFGLSDKTWGTVSLPYDATAIGWKNCSIEAEPLFMVATKTSGGTTGSSAASIATPIPAISILTGLSIYSQWAIFDVNSANGWVSFSNALHHVIGG